jgi:hypothetical protein
MDEQSIDDVSHQIDTYTRTQTKTEKGKRMTRLRLIVSIYI